MRRLTIGFLSLVVLGFSACGGAASTSTDARSANTEENAGSEAGRMSMPETKQYCNENYGFCINYPIEFEAQGESASQDGQEFLYNGMSIIAAKDRSEEADPENFSLENAYKADCEEMTEILQKSFNNTDYTVAGISKEQVVYKKVIRSSNGLAVCEITAPLAQKESIASLANTVFASFQVK